MIRTAPKYSSLVHYGLPGVLHHRWRNTVSNYVIASCMLWQNGGSAAGYSMHGSIVCDCTSNSQVD